MQKLSFLLLAAVLSLTATAQRGRMMQRIIEKRLDKDAAENTGPVPDYANLYYWAASPYKKDAADSVPAFLKDEQRDSAADVFYIHPTTFIKGTGEDGVAEDAEQDMEALFAEGNRKNMFASLKTASWNADVDDTALNALTDARPILNQATVFNASCRVFAPRYRQANLKAFAVRNSKEAQAAFDLAYGDIKRAFQYYLEHDNNGRPIIIASHSQGSLHAKRLLQEFFDGRPLTKQLVCAYIIGYQVEPETFKALPVCNTAGATGCFVTWRSYVQGVVPQAIKDEKGKSVCVNPLTWSTGTSWADSSLNIGSLFKFNYNIAGKVGAGIEPASKVLWVSMPAQTPDKLKKLKNLHILDYNLFWMNLRENVQQRVEAYLGEQQKGH